MRLSGFTLLELLFSLALTGMVLLLGFGVYRLLGDWSKRYETQLDEAAQFSLLTRRLQIDFREANTAQYESGSLQLQLSPDELLCQYHKTDSSLIRQAKNRQDTFPFLGTWGNDLQGDWYIEDTVVHLRANFQLLPQARAKP